MNTKASIAFVGAAALGLLLACSTPKPAPPVAAAAPDWPAVPEPEVSIELPLEPTPAPFGKVCKLGTPCLAMDPRPFEACLLSTKSCVDKATEPLLTVQPEWLAPPAIIETRE